MTETLILIDGSSYLYRAYHAMPNLTNTGGESTGAVYGMVNMLRRLMKEQPTERVAVVFDAPGKTFRDDLYADYKANRPPMPAELRSQIDDVHQVIAALGIPMLHVTGVEADDVIGTLVCRAVEQGLEVVVVSGDKDLAQLVQEGVVVRDTMKDVSLDAAKVKEKFGVPPALIIDYLALVGDSVDNVPGVSKVGPKTAVKWLSQYGSLDGVIAHAGEIGGKIGENLRAALEQLPLSRQLVTIKCDVDTGDRVDDLIRRPVDRDALKALYARLEFKTWLAELTDSERDSPERRSDYEVILTEDALKTWTERLSRAELIAVDTETTSLDAMEAELVGLSFTDQAGRAAYLPVGHRYPDAPEQLALEIVLAHLRPILENPSIGKVGQNLKYDLTVLARQGVALNGIQYDTMLESYVLDSTGSRHDMDTLALRFLSYKTVKFEEVAGKGKGQKTFDQVSLDEAGFYAAEDADIAMRLHEAILPELERTPALLRLFKEIEIPLVPVLSRIERNGVRVDSDMLKMQSRELEAAADEVQTQAYAIAGESFNLSSPKQIQHILFEKLALPVMSKTPKGQPSTAENVLQELAEQYELPAMILRYRGLSKLRSTYTDKLPSLVNPTTGRIHTSYHQAVAATGRLSSADPNLQNIPVRSAEGRRIREAFIAQTGYRLIAADYSQIELRIMAHLSGDEGLLRAFENDEDIHRATAAEVFGRDMDTVSTEERRSAKAINFGLIYGMSAFGLARQLGIERAEAQQYIDLYFSRYPGVRAFMDRTRELAREQRFVETVFGRRLYLNEINSPNHARRQYAERTAINAPMQGTAADLIKKAMLAVDEWIETSEADAMIIMQVHDELVLEVAEAAVEETKSALISLMTGVADLKVPLKADVGVGINWADAHS